MQKKAYTHFGRPQWLRSKASWARGLDAVNDVLSEYGLASVCDEASCPNKAECWQDKHITFLVLGKNCTRDCRFCNVSHGIPHHIDAEEPVKISEAVRKLGAKYVVITSVTRDDLPDKGAGHFAHIVSEIKKASPDTMVELLIPDMDADAALIEIAAFSGADVVGHNIEMAEELYQKVRPASGYRRSLKTLSILKTFARKTRTAVKTAMMVGLGESRREIDRVIGDVAGESIDILYVGQYLSPAPGSWPVMKYYTQEEFDRLKRTAEKTGIRVVKAGAMVRSSYKSMDAYLEFRKFQE